jgi:hypothetical protein
MDDTALTIIAVGLFIAWVFGPIVILQYIRVVVPRRLKEIKDWFLSSQDGDESGAWHYARLLNPGGDPKKTPEDILEDQFWQFHAGKYYAPPLILVIALSGLMLAFTGLWLANSLSSTRVPTTLLSLITIPFIMALLGAFVWFLYEILSRRNSGDLTPACLYNVAFRFITAVPIGYAFSLLVFDTVPGLVAFAVSAFPLRDVRLFMSKQALQKIGESSQATSSRTSKGYIGKLVSGLGNDTLARLQELNIETYLDLAYADPIHLMVATGVPIKLALSWIDQALPAVYFPKQKHILDQLGMPCALDLWEFYTNHYVDVAGKQKNWRDDQAVKDLSAKLDIPIEVLYQPLTSLYEDPNAKFLTRVSHQSAARVSHQSAATEGETGSNLNI